MTDHPTYCTVRELVMAAIWTRMSGAASPIFTSGGSGNQTLILSIPLLFTADELEADEYRTMRAVLCAHAINLYFKSHLEAVAHTCVGVSAAAGAAGATVLWLADGDETGVTHAINTLVGSLYGMVWDGARLSCALKGSTAAVEAINAARMAASGFALPAGEGIIGHNVRDTLQRIKRTMPGAICNA